MLCENKNNELACSDNAYVIEYKERTLAAMGRTNILQEENGGNISMEEELCEEKKEDRAQPKLRDVLEYLKDDSNTKTQNSIVIFENPYRSATSRIIDNNECCLDILYDNALDDGLILIDNSPCIHEDKNDELAGCDDAHHWHGNSTRTVP
jgi:hypothetical protein